MNQSFVPVTKGGLLEDVSPCCEAGEVMSSPSSHWRKCALPVSPDDFYFTSCPVLSPWGAIFIFSVYWRVKEQNNKTPLSLCSRFSFSPLWKLTSFPFLFCLKLLENGGADGSGFIFILPKFLERTVSLAYDIWWLLCWQWVALISIFPVFISRFLFAFQVGVWAGQQSYLFMILPRKFILFLSLRDCSKDVRFYFFIFIFLFLKDCSFARVTLLFLCWYNSLRVSVRLK